MLHANTTVRALKEFNFLAAFKSNNNMNISYRTKHFYSIGYFLRFCVKFLANSRIGNKTERAVERGIGEVNVRLSNKNLITLQYK